MDRNLLLQSLAQEALRQSRMQTLVVVQQASGPFRNGEATGQKFWDEISYGEARGAENNLSDRLETQQKGEDFTVRPNVGDASSPDAPGQGR
jgi:hypothetical protein